MRTWNSRGRAAIGALALLGMAGVGAQSPATAATAAIPADATIDEVFAAVADEVPTFGGMYVDEATGSLHVWTTNGSTHAAEMAQDTLARVFKTENFGTLKVVAQHGRYGFGTLKGWHDRLTLDVLALPGSVLTDIDEQANRLLVGVEDLAAHGDGVRAAAARLGIPRDAVVVEEMPPVTLDTSVQDLHRPVRGGIQMGFTNSSGGSSACTIGFVAVRAGVSGIVSNSHCTTIQGGVQNTVIYQPSNLGGVTRIAQETRDPSYVAGGACPAGRVCRHSDSAFSTADSTALLDQGFIARTAVGTISWNGIDTWRITGEANPTVGMTITKQGRTSGRNSGRVSNTCVNINLGGSSITQLCQAQVEPDISDPGDSGSPVFTFSGTDVTLRGINWGSNGTSAFFSPIGNVQMAGEMGSISTCASGFGC